MGAPRRPMPEDFLAHARESVPSLTKRYHADQSTIRRWRESLGIKIAAGFPKRGVVQYDMDGNIIARYDSVTAATKAVYGSISHIRAALNGLRAHAYGFQWRYENGT